MTFKTSPFLYPGALSKDNSLAIVHLKRDLQIPTILKEHDEDNEGYSEGKVVNTRFGSFPHKTLIGLPWGSQVRASKVDTGSRGRRPKVENKKRKPRPGKNIIEAGAGSGSFTHASSRAVFNGYPGTEHVNGSPTKERRYGKVWSYEFHAQRHEKLLHEIQDHGLGKIVEITHRDVCHEGFLVNGKSPNAECIFLDLPAPWLALPHLARSRSMKEDIPTNVNVDLPPFVSPLSPTAPVHICTFSPCIEQVQRTVSVMRKLGWVDIEMVELSQKRFEIRRERIGIDNGTQRGIQATAASVDEAINRLKEVEGTFKLFHENGEKVEPTKKNKENPNTRAKLLESLVEKKVYKEGRLVHRTEPEVKAHTSYLVFAVLPREWDEEDERLAREKWPVQFRMEDQKVEVEGEVIGMSRRQKKRVERQASKDKAAAEARDNEESELTSAQFIDAELKNAPEDSTVENTAE
ncbi:hypothetical protein BUE80_DR001245 [Diplocarpon rosae]|nr:hypothetical protein BUE80_DR001245 [Diplocarpon rosae]